MMSYSIFVFWYYLLALGNCLQNYGECRTLEFQTPVAGSALFGHVIKSYIVKTRNHCELKCYLEAECMSINYGPWDHGVYLCELSDSDHNLHPGDLKQRVEFIYTPTENACASDPCSLNGRCQTGFTDKGYRCICSAGFMGDDCSIETADFHEEARPDGISCQHILQSGRSVGDGEYLIDPEDDGTPLMAYCDMTTEGGGWLLVANIVMNGSKPSSPWSASEDYQDIRYYLNNKMGISRYAMNQLRAHLSFTQLRFHCSKKTRRTFHVVTVPNSTGEAVVQYFSGQTDARPQACGSFTRVKDDNSRLAKTCDEWDKNGKWGREVLLGSHQMYRYPVSIPDRYSWMIVLNNKNGETFCDDNSDTISTGDFWKIFVR